MIVEGLKLTLLGVGVVFLFLSLLVVVIKLSSRILKPITAREEAAYNPVPAKKTVNRRAEEELQRVMAVINAAIAAHRARKAVVARAGFGGQGEPVMGAATGRPDIHSLSPAPTDGAGNRKYRAGELFFRDRSTLGGFLYHR